MLSVLEQIERATATTPTQAVMLNARGGALSAAQLTQRVRNIARGFSLAGMRPGERVLFAVRPDAEAAILMLGIAHAGGVLVPLDITMGPALFAQRMQTLAPRWVVAESLLLLAGRNPLARYLLARRGIRLPPLHQIPGTQSVRVGPAGLPIAADHCAARLERRGADTSLRPLVPHADDETMIVFTSGTSGTPKAVVHTRRSMQGVFDTVAALLDAGAGDVVYARELHLIIPAILRGAAAAVPGRRAFSARRLLRDVRKYGVTHLFCVASEVQQLFAHLDARGQTLPASVREIWIGAAPVHASLLERIATVVAKSTKLWCVYGMTEILPVARVALGEKMAFAGSGDLVGACVPGVHARIADDGELMLRGPNMFAGYLGEPACTEHASGDLARLDAGRIVLLGRRVDMIIRGRFNIYPELYESTIERIDGVQACAMLGIHDPATADERVVLVVEPQRGTDGAQLEARLWQALRSGPSRIDAKALPDKIVVMPLPLAGRSRKVDKARLRKLLDADTACASR